MGSVELEGGKNEESARRPGQEGVEGKDRADISGYSNEGNQGRHKAKKMNSFRQGVITTVHRAECA